jgi:hypothetical protein
MTRVAGLLGGRRESPASIVGALFDGLTAAGLRYGPVFLVALGASPLGVGLVGSYWLVLSGAIGGPLLARLPLDGRGVGDLLATLGVCALVLAPVAGRSPALVASLAVGVGLLALRASGSSLGAHPATLGVLGRSGVGRGLLALAAGLAFVGALLDGARRVLPALTAVFAIATAVGVVVVVLRAVGDGSRPSTPGAERPLDPGGLLRAFVDAPATVRSVVLADLTGRFAHALAAPFVVLTVVYGREFDVVALGARPGAATAFAGLAVAEALGAAVGVPLAIAVGRRLGPTLVGLGAIVASTAIPLAVALAPARPLVFGALFVGYGLRHGGWTTVEAIVATQFGPAVERTYRLAGGLAVAPGALLGGALYGVAPTATFGVAALVGAVACREWLHYALGGHPGGRA